MVILGDEKTFGRYLHGHDARQRAGRDNQTAGMHAQVVGLADEGKGGSQRGPVAGISHLCQNIVQRAPRAAARVGMPAVRQQAGEALHARLVVAESLGRLAYGRARLQRGHRGDKRDAVLPVSAAHVGQNLGAAARAEVEVDIRQAGPGRVQKTLEEQVVGQRVDAGNAQAVGDETVGDAAARAHGNTRFFRKAHDVGNHQKERRKAVTVDGRELLLEARRGVLTTGRIAGA